MEENILFYRDDNRLLRLDGIWYEDYHATEPGRDKYDWARLAGEPTRYGHQVQTLPDNILAEFIAAKLLDRVRP